MEFARSGDVKGLAMFYAGHPTFFVTQNHLLRALIVLAARHGHLPLLQWVCDQMALLRQQHVAAGRRPPCLLSWRHYLRFISNAALNAEHVHVLDWLYLSYPEVFHPGDLLSCSGRLSLHWLTQHVNDWRTCDPGTIRSLIKRAIHRHYWSVLWWLEDRDLLWGNRGAPCLAELEKQLAPVREILGRDVWSLVRGYV